MLGSYIRGGFEKGVTREAALVTQGEQSVQSREMPLPLTRDEIGLYLDRTVLPQRKSSNICVPSVVQLGAATPVSLTS